MKKLIILTGLLLSTSAYAQTEVTAGVTRGKDYGVTYALPKTAINIEVKVNKVTYTPGEFSKYADRYLRLTDVSGCFFVSIQMSSISLFISRTSVHNARNLHTSVSNRTVLPSQVLLLPFSGLRNKWQYRRHDVA